MSNQPVATINLDQLLEESGTFQYTNHETGPIIPLVIFAILVIVGLNFVSDLIKASIKNERHASRKTSRSRIPAKSLVKNVSKAEELPELAPAAASVAPEVEPTVTAVPVVEPAPAPVVDPAFGWSTSVDDEALSTPAFMRKVGLTAFEAYKFAFHPDFLRFCTLRKQEKAAGLGHFTSAVDFFARREPELGPVFVPGERLLVGFDGVPVH